MPQKLRKAFRRFYAFETAHRVIYPSRGFIGCTGLFSGLKGGRNAASAACREPAENTKEEPLFGGSS